MVSYLKSYCSLSHSIIMFNKVLTIRLFIYLGAGQEMYLGYLISRNTSQKFGKRVARCSS